MSSPEQSRYVISLVVPDRPGILRDLTATVTDMGAYIDGISQTVVSGYFTVLMTAIFDKETDKAEIRRIAAKRFAGTGAELIVTPFHTVKERTGNGGQRYVITLSGVDQSGVLKAVTTFMADRGINIEDWSFSLSDGAVTHIGEITVPEKLDIGQLQADFREALARFELTSGLHHENIFRAMQEITPIKPLIRGDR